jgi:hypothetical protein
MHDAFAALLDFGLLFLHIYLMDALAVLLMKRLKQNVDNKGDWYNNEDG